MPPNLAERVASLETRAERAGMDINGLYELHNELRADISMLQSTMYSKVEEIKAFINIRMEEIRKEKSSLMEQIFLVLVGAIVSGVATYFIKGG